MDKFQIPVEIWEHILKFLHYEDLVMTARYPGFIGIFTNQQFWVKSLKRDFLSIHLGEDFLLRIYTCIDYDGLYYLWSYAKMHGYGITAIDILFKWLPALGKLRPTSRLDAGDELPIRIIELIMHAPVLSSRFILSIDDESLLSYLCANYPQYKNHLLLAAIGNRRDFISKYKDYTLSIPVSLLTKTIMDVRMEDIMQSIDTEYR